MIALAEAIRRSGVPVKEISAGDRLRGGDGCTIEVLHPPRVRVRQRQRDIASMAFSLSDRPKCCQILSLPVKTSTLRSVVESRPDQARSGGV